MMKQDIEIMSPAGSFESLAAAIKAGADSVYLGVEQLNMRARAANNFTLNDLKKVADICRKNKVRSYLALNTIMYDHDIKIMQKICNAVKESGITAVIASDVAAISYANSIGLEVHISTQANVSNLETVKFYSKFADVIVLARELTLQQIKTICDAIKKENIVGSSGNPVGIELFAHGALCVAISGKCYMSLATYNASANRGACLQNCRRSYRVIDEETGDELRVENKFVMSPKDLCTIGFIDKIISAGVRVLKIEGRGKSADYVYVVTKTYRDAVDSCLDGSFSKEKVDMWIAQLETVYNRGFWHGGYYLGRKIDSWSRTYGSKATKEKVYVGIVNNYLGRKGIAEIYVQTGTLKKGDEIAVIGQTTGIVMFKICEMRKEDNSAETAGKNEIVTIPVHEKIRKNDKVYVLAERKQTISV